MLDAQAKKNLKSFGIFFAIFIAMTTILVASILLVKGTKQRILAEEMQEVLNQRESDEYIVGNPISLKSCFSTSAAAYSLLKVGANPSDTYVGVIIRIPTIFGSMPSLFICKNGANAEFVDFMLDVGKAKSISETRISSSILNYWEKNIPRILEKGEAHD